MRVFGEDAALLARAGADPAGLAGLEEGLTGLVAPADRAGGIDAHVHLGRDRDGHALGAPDLLRDLDRWGLAGAVCFPADDPGADGQFAAANAAVLEAARRARGRIVPFCRVDPARPGAAAAMERAGAGGARGLKLHPIAQRFRPEDPGPVAAVREAAGRGWPVVVHAGYGARPLAGPIAAVLEAAPGARLVLAHAGRGDARALAALARGRAGVLFDTSLAALPDLVALPPSALCFGSDRPFGEHATALQAVGLAARAAGWSAADLSGVMGGNLRRWVAT